MFDLLKKKIGGFIENLTKKEEKAEPEKPPLEEVKAPVEEAPPEVKPAVKEEKPPAVKLPEEKPKAEEKPRAVPKEKPVKEEVLQEIYMLGFLLNLIQFLKEKEMICAFQFQLIFLKQF